MASAQAGDVSLGVPCAGGVDVKGYECVFGGHGVEGGTRSMKQQSNQKHSFNLLCGQKVVCKKLSLMDRIGMPTTKNTMLRLEEYQRTNRRYCTRKTPQAILAWLGLGDKVWDVLVPGQEALRSCHDKIWSCVPRNRV